MMEARLHEMGYTYTKPKPFYALTYQEIRRVLHGKNVLEEQKGGDSDTKKRTGAKKRRPRPTEQERKAMKEFKEKNDLK